MTGVDLDGHQLVAAALGLGGLGLMIAFDSLGTDTERNEQNGLRNIMKGAFGAFRNPSAHAPRCSVSSASSAVSQHLPGQPGQPTQLGKAMPWVFAAASGCLARPSGTAAASPRLKPRRSRRTLTHTVPDRPCGVAIAGGAGVGTSAAGSATPARGVGATRSAGSLVPCL